MGKPAEEVDLSFNSKHDGVQYALGAGFEVRGTADGYDAVAVRPDLDKSFTLVRRGPAKYYWMEDK